MIKSHVIFYTELAVEFEKNGICEPTSVGNRRSYVGENVRKFASI